MTNTYLTPSGHTLTDDTINTWCKAYEKGTFPTGEHSTGDIIYGRPPLSTDTTTVLSIKIPEGMKKAIQQAAKQHGTTPSAYARQALTEKLLSA